MMTRKAIVHAFTIVVAAALLAGCSSTPKKRIPDGLDPVLEGEATKQDAAQALKTKLQNQIEHLENNKDKFKDQVVSLPSGEIKYYYRYYDEFPRGVEAEDIKVKALDTIAPVFKADVRYRKVRYQTRYATSSRRAARDDDFIRDEGVQKEVYDFDGVVWRLKSSIFEVRKTSVYGQNKWVATQDRITRIEEVEPEYFIDKLRTGFGLFD
jgi:outer membrane murein-binding lipoprotein Lpp